MITPHYRFLNLHISIWIKYFITGTIFGVIFLAILGLPQWIVLSVLTLGIGIIYFMKKGSVSISHGLKSSNIVIKSDGKTLTLASPVQVDVWWNYSFKTKAGAVSYGTAPTKARADDINVMLEIEDKNGQKVTFIEKIVFDFRFPNEANYSLDSVDKTAAQFKVQRVDKLMTFLKNQIIERV